MAREIRRNKTKFVLHKELIILIVVLVAMITTTICLSIPTGSEKNLAYFNNAISNYNTANNASYTTLTEETVFKTASLNTIRSSISKSSKGTEDNPEYVYVFYGNINDSSVLQYLSKIDIEAQNRKVKQVYFYSSEKVDKQEDKEDASFIASIEKDEEVFNASVLEGVEKVDLLKTPALFTFKNGELVFNSNPILDDGSYNWELIINQAFSK